MQIHVVQQGQTLYGIANAYNTTISQIIVANEIQNPDQLVVGQALVIPVWGNFYTIRSGDTLSAIGQRFNINYTELARINNISINEPLQVGFRLFIPPKPKTSAEINAYVEPIGTSVTPALEEAAEEATPYLTYLAPFSYRIQRDGNLIEPLLNNFPQIAVQNEAGLMMVLSNLEEGQFSTELARIILTNEEMQNRLLDNIARIANDIGFIDVHFDLEFISPENREDYNNFLRKAKEKLSPEGITLSTALAPKTSSTQRGLLYEAHDYRAHGEIVDFVVLMTYEWGYSAGPPMPVSPIGPVRQVIEYALTEMPSSKIMMGQNLYGYDWTLPYVQGGQYARAVSPQQAIEIARVNNVPIKYDYKAQAPYIDYVDNQGRSHKVWFEDARSIQAKFNLIKELNLRGISYWKLGLSFPQNWLLIEENFNVIKLV
ncbi:glycoside hydrolase family 18 protein [Clostridium sp. HMP27]|uniref:glycoside hydrolase family 18 protein n=1 Tax=Clostridium sp. HMP27 TaxID=1487921 RepID=UPI00052D9E63|nr:glycoside hydrolase family 18 protein [Clostridium sp. HMP27]KGK85961.1 spore gernimation protein [Clostridium sp. HMP27]